MQVSFCEMLLRNAKVSSENILSVIIECRVCSYTGLFNHLHFLNDRLAEAEEDLLSMKKPKSDALDAIVAAFGDSAPFACKLYGTICSETDRSQPAKDAYIKSLKLNPFLWESFSNVCNMGENVDPNSLFQVSYF